VSEYKESISGKQKCGSERERQVDQLHFSLVTRYVGMN
jgi:hypothetical protein